MEAHHYISLSTRTSYANTKRYRVRLKYHNGDTNSVDQTLEELDFGTKSAAMRQVKILEHAYQAIIIGDFE